MNNQFKYTTFQTGLSANGAPTSGVLCGEATTIRITLTGAGGANFTVKFLGTEADTQPTWGSAASFANPYDNIGFSTDDSPTPVDGDTGIVFAGNDTVQVELNVGHLTYFNVIISNYVAGTLSVAYRLISQS